MFGKRRLKGGLLEEDEFEWHFQMTRTGMWGSPIFFKTVPFVLYMHHVTNFMASKLCPSKSTSDHTVFISNNYLLVRAMRLGARYCGKS